MKRLLISVFIPVGVILLLSLTTVLFQLSGCKKVVSSVVSPLDSVPLPSRGFYLGMLPTPAQGQILDSAYAEARRFCEFVPVWGRPTRFYELADDLGGWWGETFVTKLIRDNGMFPLIHMSFIDTGLTLVTPPNLPNATLKDHNWRKAYLQAAVTVVRTIRPRFLSLGNEVNRWYERYGADSGNPNGFIHYVTLYNEIYDSVKAVSPQTEVFCVFSREIVSENRTADMTVLDLFDPERLDMLIFTTYPYVLPEINRPEEVPNDYYYQIAKRMPGKRFGFSEAGWSSHLAFGGESAQADFVRDLVHRLTRDQGVNLYFLGWAWLTDLSNTDYIGLKRIDGSAKPAFYVWQEISGR